MGILKEARSRAERANQRQTQDTQMKYPRWFPCPTAWTKAIGSAILLGIFATITEPFLPPIHSVSFKSTDIFRDCVVFLAPIPIIAIAHHYFYRLLDQFHSSARSPHATKYPKLSSLWEGIWAWSAIVIAAIPTILLTTFVPGATEEFFFSSELNGLLVLFWLMLVAYLHQLEEMMQNP